MPTLYLTRSGSVLRYENNCFVAEARGEAAVTVPEFRVERVVAFGPVHLTQPAISRLLAKRVEVQFLTRFGVPRGRLCSADDGRSDVRLAQYRAFCDDEFRLRVARAMVSAKIANCRQVVMRYQRNHPDAALGDVVRELAKRPKDAEHSPSIVELRGIEGAAAALYFGAFERMIGDKQLFDGRSRRPPRDPANALLSLGYTLLGGEIAGLLAAHGLDPYIGFYHEARRGLPALAQDVLEEFRAPVVDRLVLAVLNKGQIENDDFCPGPRGGLRLQERALKKFLRLYEKSLNEQFKARNGEVSSFRRALAAQAGAIRRSAESRSDYPAFRWQRG